MDCETLMLMQRLLFIVSISDYIPLNNGTAGVTLLRRI